MKPINELCDIVTTQHLTAGQLGQLSDDVGPDRSLLVLCAAFRAPKDGPERFPNLTVKKIPKTGVVPLRMGQGRLQPQGRKPPESPATRRAGGADLAAKERKEHKDEESKIRDLGRLRSLRSLRSFAANDFPAR
ncbi:MAG TPA: hypothetical protein VGA56_02350 [Opitutaceae bacterium]